MGSLPSVAESSIGQSFDSVGVSLKLASGCQRQRWSVHGTAASGRAVPAVGAGDPLAALR